MQKNLSGGQRQRVAMGRAIVRHPSVFLMDEPLSNLDAKLRVQTRTQIASLQRRLGVTTVYVTHDQVEAMTMGDRVAVLKDGLLQQCDTPRKLYDQPANAFVAGFIGSPSMNLLTLNVVDGGVEFGDTTTPVERAVLGQADDSQVILGVRPEDLQLAEHGIPVEVGLVEELGADAYIYGTTTIHGDQHDLIARVDGRRPPEKGQTVHLAPQPATRTCSPPTTATASTTDPGSRSMNTSHTLFGPGTPPVPDKVGDVVDCDIAVIGSGMGGGTLAHALRNSGANVLVIERGDFLPREAANSSPVEVFGSRRYKNAEKWFDGSNGKPFGPGVHYYVGGNTKVYGACLPRFRAEDFDELKTHDGISPAWPVGYAEMEPYYAEAERLYGVHGNRGEDPTDPPRSGDFPFPALEHEPSIAALAASMTAQGLHPVHMPMGVDIRPGGRVRTHPDLRRVPVPARRQGRCRGAGRAAGAAQPDGATAHPHGGDPSAHLRRRPAGGGGRGRAGRTAGADPGREDRRRRGRGQLGGAAAALDLRPAPPRPRQLLGPGRPQLHGAQQHLLRGCRPAPAQPGELPEDPRGQRLVPARAGPPVPAGQPADAGQAAGLDDQAGQVIGTHLAAGPDRRAQHRHLPHDRRHPGPGQPDRRRQRRAHHRALDTEQRGPTPGTGAAGDTGRAARRLPLRVHRADGGGARGRRERHREDRNGDQDFDEGEPARLHPSTSLTAPAASPSIACGNGRALRARRGTACRARRE